MKAWSWPALLALLVASGAAAQSADLSHGQEVFGAICSACHSVDRAERGLQGPNLAGVAGRAAGAQAGFAYTPAFKRLAASGLTWTDATLDRYLKGPETMVPGGAMTIDGLDDPADRRGVIAYLKAHR